MTNSSAAFFEKSVIGGSSSAATGSSEIAIRSGSSNAAKQSAAEEMTASTLSSFASQSPVTRIFGVTRPIVTGLQAEPGGADTTSTLAVSCGRDDSGMPTYSLVIPASNEEGVIQELIAHRSEERRVGKEC